MLITKRLLIISIFLFLINSAPLVLGFDDEYQGLLYKGRVLFNQGRYSQALAEYGKALKLESSSKEVIFNMAVIYKNMRSYEQAIEQYEKLIAIEPNKVLYFNIGELYYLNSMPDKAISSFNEAIRMGEDGYLVYFWLGRCFQDKNDLDNSIRAYKQSIERDNAFILAHLLLGQLYLRDQIWESAGKEFEKVKELDPSVTELYPALASIYSNEKKYKLALEAYGKIRALEPDNPDIQKSIDAVYALAGGEFSKRISQENKDRISSTKAVSVKEKLVKGAPIVSVHVASAKQFRFKCSSDFLIFAQKTTTAIPVAQTGAQEEKGQALYKGSKDELVTIKCADKKICLLNNEGKIFNLPDKINIVPVSAGATILIFDVETGKGNYWANKIDRLYRGQIGVILAQEDELCLINTVNFEEYLYGVLPSEMPDNWPIEALKAQAVAARSEAYAKLGRHKNEGFDFCADVHCQSYGGAAVEAERTCEAVDATTGEIAEYQKKAIDAVYSNSCGGHTQGNIYGDRKAVPYLEDKVDAIENPGFIFPLSALELEDWLWLQDIPVFCNNETFSRRSNFRWVRLYTRKQLEELINKKIDIGTLICIDIAERNPSSHVHRIQVTGTKGKFMIEKELNIRQLFGNLRSGMFNIDVKQDKAGNALEFIFYGGGWGHGVGMCQAGAATMAEQGYTYEQILKFYYTGIEIEKIY